MFFFLLFILCYVMFGASFFWFKMLKSVYIQLSSWICATFLLLLLLFCMNWTTTTITTKQNNNQQNCIIHVVNVCICFAANSQCGVCICVFCVRVLLYFFFLKCLVWYVSVLYMYLCMYVYVCVRFLFNFLKKKKNCSLILKGTFRENGIAANEFQNVWWIVSFCSLGWGENVAPIKKSKQTNKQITIASIKWNFLQSNNV